MKLPLLYKDRRGDGDTPIRQSQLVSLHVLEVFKRICEDHGLQFWLAHGTLLGALRHRGFVPWDDDVDVWITKADYEKFLSFAADELPDDVFLDMPNSEEAYRQENQLTRLRDNYSTGFLKHNKRLLVNDHHGIGIELFVLEESGGRCALSSWFLHRYMSGRGYYRRACYDRVTVTNLLKKWYLAVAMFLPCVVWRIIQILAVKKKYLLQTNFYTAWKWWMPVDWFLRPHEKTRTTVFEGIEMPIPFEAEKFLEMQYGDWQKLPSEDKRKGYLWLIFPTTPCLHPAAMRYCSTAGGS